MRRYLAAVASLNRNVRLLLIVAAMIGLGVIGIASVLTNLYVLRLGYPVEYLGILGGVGFAVFALMALPAGAVGARIGERHAMILGISVVILSVISFLLMESLYPSIRGFGLVMTYAFAWIGAAFLLVNITPLIATYTTPDQRGLAFSLYVAMLNVLGFIGSLVAGILPGIATDVLHTTLDQPEPYQLSLAVIPILYIVALLAVIATEEPSPGLTQIPDAGADTRTERRGAAAPYALILIVGVILLLRVTSDQAAGSFFNVYLDDALAAPTSLIGAVMGFSRLLVGITVLASPWFIARWGLVRAFTIVTILQAISVLPLALIPTWFAAGVGFLGVSLMAAIGITIITVFHQQVVEAEWRSIMSGAGTLAGGIGQAVVLFGGGFLIAAAGYAPFFLVCAGLTLFAAVVFWSYFRKPRGTFAASPVAEQPEPALTP